MSSVSSVGRSFLTTAGRQKYEASTYFDAINEKFSKLRMQVADFKSAKQFSTLGSKVNVLLSEELLAAAGSDEAMATQLEKRLKELPDLAAALTGRFKTNLTQDLRSVGFSVDKRGNLSCHGTVRKTGSFEDTRFDIKLGNLKEKSADFLSRLTRDFDTQAFRLNLLA